MDNDERLGTVTAITGGTATVMSSTTQPLGIGVGTEIYVNDIITTHGATLTIETDCNDIIVGPALTVRLDEDSLNGPTDEDGRINQEQLQQLLSTLPTPQTEQPTVESVAIKDAVEQNDEGVSFVFVERNGASAPPHDLLILNDSPLILDLPEYSENIS
jgi:hypothetical protein